MIDTQVETVNKQFRFTQRAQLIMGQVTSPFFKIFRN